MKIINVAVMAVLIVLTVRQAPFGLDLKNEEILQRPVYLPGYQDDGFDWQTLESHTLRVRWYNGDANFGQASLRAAYAGLESIRTLIPLDLAEPIEIFIYANADDLRGTLNPGAEAWVVGHADPAPGVVKVLIEPGTEQSILMDQRIPHELMHVMLYRHVGAGYHNVPAWLREGLATLAETYPNPDYERVLSDAVATDTLIPLKDLCTSFPSTAGEAFLAYAESRSFTDYIRDTYGSSGLLSLAAYYADGVDCDHGTERAYGVSLSKLELEWRESVLGQSALGPALRNMMPYLVLLCLVLVVPFLGGLSMIRRKGKGDGPETYAR